MESKKMVLRMKQRQSKQAMNREPSTKKKTTTLSTSDQTRKRNWKGLGLCTHKHILQEMNWKEWGSTAHQEQQQHNHAVASIFTHLNEKTKLKWYGAGGGKIRSFIRPVHSLACFVLLSERAILFYFQNEKSIKNFAVLLAIRARSRIYVHFR